MAKVQNKISLQDRSSSLVRMVAFHLQGVLSAIENVNTQLSHIVNDRDFHIQEMILKVENINIAIEETGFLSNDVLGDKVMPKVEDPSVNELEDVQRGMMEGIKSFLKPSIDAKTVKMGLELADEVAQNEARLNWMNDGRQSTERLQKMIYGASQASFLDYPTMMSTVANLGNGAGNTFGSSKEVIAFAEQWNKQLILAGASANEIKKGTKELALALSDGIFNWDEFNTMFQQVPSLIQSISAYLEAPMEEIRKMTMEGKIGADIVKAAVFALGEETNKKFQSLPMTWEGIRVNMKNIALVNFQPLFRQLSAMAQNKEIQQFLYSLAGEFSALAKALVPVFNIALGVASVFIKNWSWLGTLVYSTAAAILYYKGALKAAAIAEKVRNAVQKISSLLTAVLAATSWNAARAAAAQEIATWGLNAALISCPLFWVIGGLIVLIAVIGAVVGAFNNLAGTSLSAGGIILGVFAFVGAAIYNSILGIIQILLTSMQFVWDLFSAFGNFLANIFKDPIGAIIHLFGGLGDACLGILEGIASALDFIFNSHLADRVSGWRSKFQDVVHITGKEKGNGEYESFMPSFSLGDALGKYGIQGMDYKSAYQSGYDYGKNFFPHIDSMGWGASKDYGLWDDKDSMDLYVRGIQEDTGSICDSVNMTEDELIYLKDIAGQKFINEFTTLTPTMNVEFGEVKETADVYKIFEAIETMTEQALASALIT